MRCSVIVLKPSSMEGLFFLLIAAFVYSGYHVVRSLASGDADVEARPISGEVFPTIDVFNEMSVPDEEPVQEPVVKKRPVSMLRQEGKRTTAVARPVEEQERPKERKLARFSSKSEARKAVIYSEIFNRKY